MKRISLFIVAMICTAQIGFAQSQTVAEDLKLSENAGKLLLDWASEKDLDENEYWEVQGSVDAKTYKTIGLVLGENPAKAGHYTFKQNASKMPLSYSYFRVLRVNNSNQAVSSSVVRFTK